MPKLTEDAAEEAVDSLLEQFFQTGREQGRLVEIIGIGVGDHISPVDLSIDINKWRLDRELIEKWNALDPETRRAIIKRRRKTRYSDPEQTRLLEEALRSDNPPSVLFTHEEQYCLWAIMKAGMGYEYVDCRAWMLRTPDTIGYDYGIRTRVQKRWNSLPTDLRMKLRDCITSPSFYQWTPRD